MLIKKAGTTIAGVRVTSLSVDNTPIDITSADSTGLQKLMNESAHRALTFTVSGVETDGVLYGVAIGTGNQLLTDITITQAAAGITNDVITGDWYMTNFKLDGDYKDAIQFSASFTSSGTWTTA